MNVKSNNAKKIWTVIGASSAGTLIEWYDHLVRSATAWVASHS